MNQDKKTEKLEMLQSHEAHSRSGESKPGLDATMRQANNAEFVFSEIVSVQQKAGEGDNCRDHNLPPQKKNVENSACKLLTNTRVLKAESPVNRRLKYNTAFILARTQKSRRIKTDYAALRDKVRKFRVWYECVECELLIVSQTSERLFLFCSTFESETGLFVKPFVTENTVQVCTNCHAFLFMCIFGEWPAWEIPFMTLS